MRTTRAVTFHTNEEVRKHAHLYLSHDDSDRPDYAATFARCGRMTACYLSILRPRGVPLTVLAVSICSEADNFSRRTGREIALRRALAAANVPGVDDAFLAMFYEKWPDPEIKAQIRKTKLMRSRDEWRRLRADLADTERTNFNNRTFGVTPQE